MIAMFDPYRRIWLFYNHKPERPTMPADHEDLDPLRFQIQTLHDILRLTEPHVTISGTFAIVPAKAWHKLATAITDVTDCARRSL